MHRRNNVHDKLFVNSACSYGLSRFVREKKNRKNKHSTFALFSRRRKRTRAISVSDADTFSRKIFTVYQVLFTSFNRSRSYFRFESEMASFFNSQVCHARVLKDGELQELVVNCKVLHHLGLRCSDRQTRIQILTPL